MSRSLAGVLGVVPARYASVRFPGKPLVLIKGRPMVRWVYEAARRALPRAVVATDDKRIADAVRAFGGEVAMTPASCASGTDRMAAVARRIPAKIYVNIQGDEPLMSAETIRETAALAVARKSVATAATALENRDRANPNAVKVVLDKDGRALYFSRSLIPFPRDGGTPRAWKHLGLYAYPKAELFRFVRLPVSELETIERLEQLRALANGMPIYVAITRHDSVGIDTPDDLKRLVRRMGRQR